VLADDEVRLLQLFIMSRSIYTMRVKYSSSDDLGFLEHFSATQALHRQRMSDLAVEYSTFYQPRGDILLEWA
jgi:hypothetical protein